MKTGSIADAPDEANYRPVLCCQMAEKGSRLAGAAGGDLSCLSYLTLEWKRRSSELRSSFQVCERESKYRTFAEGGVRPDPAPVSLDDTTHRSKPDAGTFELILPM